MIEKDASGVAGRRSGFGGKPLNCDRLLGGVRSAGSQLGHALAYIGSVHHVAGQLATGCINVVTTGFSDRGNKACLNEDVGKLFNTVSV
jgi:hypothetical protein